MDVWLQYEFCRHLAISRREELLAARRSATPSEAERAPETPGAAGRRVVGTALVRLGERLAGSGGAGRTAAVPKH